MEENPTNGAKYRWYRRAQYKNHEPNKTWNRVSNSVCM